MEINSFEKLRLDQTTSGQALKEAIQLIESQISQQMDKIGAENHD